MLIRYIYRLHNILFVKHYCHLSHCNIYIIEDCNMPKSFYWTTDLLCPLSILTSRMFQVRSSWLIKCATDAEWMHEWMKVRIILNTINATMQHIARHIMIILHSKIITICLLSTSYSFYTVPNHLVIIQYNPTKWPQSSPAKSILLHIRKLIKRILNFSCPALQQHQMGNITAQQYRFYSRGFVLILATRWLTMVIIEDADHFITWS